MYISYTCVCSILYKKYIYIYLDRTSIDNQILIQVLFLYKCLLKPSFFKYETIQTTDFYIFK